jgi:hypothetical protein
MNTMHYYNTFKSNFFRITLNSSFNLLILYQLYFIKVKNIYMNTWRIKNYFKFLKLKNWVTVTTKLNFFFLNSWYIKKLINYNLLIWCLVKFSKRKKKFRFKKNLFKFGYKWKYKFKFKRLKNKKIIKLKIIKLWFFLNNRLNINKNSKKKFWLIWLKKKYNNVYLKRIKLIKKIKKKWVCKKKKMLNKYKKSKLKNEKYKKKSIKKKKR